MVLIDTYWKVHTIHQLLLNNRLIYNKVNKWSVKKQELFIDSLCLNGYFLPMLVMECKEEFGKKNPKEFICVDGNQRLIAIANYLETEVEAQITAQNIRVVILYNASEIILQSIKQRLNSN